MSANLVGSDPNSKGSGIILPGNVKKEIEREANSRKPQGFTIPPHLAAEAQKHMDTAIAVNQLLQTMGNGDAVTIALMTQPAVRRLLQDHMTGIMPQLTNALCMKDRASMHQVMLQVGEDRKVKASLNRESLDIASYLAAITDLYHVSSQVPLPPLNLEITAPIMPEVPAEIATSRDSTKDEVEVPN